MHIAALSPDDVYTRWDWLRDGLQRLASKTGPRYRPEDVYVRLRSNTAWAYVITDEFKDVGFLVLTQEFDPDGLVLFVWILWAEPQSLTGHSNELYEQVEDLARAIKAKRIRMHSPRDGWRAESFFRQTAVVYEHEVDHGNKSQAQG